MAPAVHLSHCLNSLPLHFHEASLALRAGPARISACLARPQPTTILTFRAPHRDAVYHQLPRSWTTRIQPVPRMTDQTELPGPRTDS